LGISAGEGGQRLFHLARMFLGGAQQVQPLHGHGAVAELIGDLFAVAQLALAMDWRQPLQRAAPTLGDLDQLLHAAESSRNSTRCLTPATI